ncbi:hypothetical protein ACQUQP_04765 [Marinobacterium sp. YM272]|uniref:hypothetical protein n=1 Tax=Marinobacterium sp. YM272 TaxID=3421654 RepID=UPI003D7FC32F
MPKTAIRILRLILILLALPGIFVTLYAGAVAVSLLWTEFFPAPNDIGHGMAMLGLLPMIAWSVLGVIYLSVLRMLWVGIGKKSKPDKWGL